jgi:hypothetical protein
VDTVVRDAKLLKSLGNRDVSGRTTLWEADRLERSSEVRSILFITQQIFSFISYYL